MFQVVSLCPLCRFKNRPLLGFDAVMGEADQTVELSKDYNGSIEYPLKCVPPPNTHLSPRTHGIPTRHLVHMEYPLKSPHTHGIPTRVTSYTWNTHSSHLVHMEYPLVTSYTWNTHSSVFLHLIYTHFAKFIIIIGGEIWY